MTYDQAFRRGMAHIAEIAAAMDPADVAVAALQAARLVRRHRTWSTQPLVRSGFASAPDLGQGDVGRLCIAAISVSLDVDTEHAGFSMGQMATALEVLAREHAETSRMADVAVAGIAERLSHGPAPDLADAPAFMIERLVAVLLPDADAQTGLEVRTASTLFDALARANLAAQGLRVMRAMESLGKDAVAGFWRAIDEQSRRWLGGMIMSERQVA